MALTLLIIFSVFCKLLLRLNVESSANFPLVVYKDHMAEWRHIGLGMGGVNRPILGRYSCSSCCRLSIVLLN